jgi:hypothetical protein
VTLLSRKRTELDLTFVGDEQQLILALAQSDLDLALNPVSGWQIRVTTAPGPTIEPGTPVPPPSAAEIVEPSSQPSSPTSE